MTKKFWHILIVMHGAILLTSCSTRNSNPVAIKGETLRYESKNKGAITAQIGLGRTYIKETKQPLFTGQLFPIAPEEEVHAIIKIHKHKPRNKVPQQFHIEWIDIDGSLLYTKEISKTITGTSAMLYSSISTFERQSGKYWIHVYYFRELIASRSFFLKDKKTYFDSLFKSIDANIKFGQQFDSDDKELVKQGIIFHKGPGKWVNAVASFQNKPPLEGIEIEFTMEWVAPDSSRIYHKDFSFTKDNYTSTMRSSISIDGDRPIGNYTVNLYWYNQLIASDGFEIKPKKKLKRIDIGPITIQLSTGSRRKEASEIEPLGTIFAEKKKKIYALVDLSKVNIPKNNSLKLQWVNSLNRVFFQKEIVVSERKNPEKIKSSISIYPGKRTPGKYKLRILYKNCIAAEQEFILSENKH